MSRGRTRSAQLQVKCKRKALLRRKGYFSVNHRSKLRHLGKYLRFERQQERPGQKMKIKKFMIYKELL